MKTGDTTLISWSDWLRLGSFPFRPSHLRPPLPSGITDTFSSRCAHLPSPALAADLWLGRWSIDLEFAAAKHRSDLTYPVLYLRSLVLEPD